MTWHIDFETRSVVDLKACGIDVYARNATTDALCMAYCKGDGLVKLWIYGQPLPREIVEAIARGEMFAAHNASFEFYLWNFVCVPKYGWPPLPLKQLDCTMIRGYAMGLPGHLGNAALSVGLKMQKDLVGQRVMLQLCKPRSGPNENCNLCFGTGVAVDKTCQCVEFYEPETAPEKFKTLYTYCKQDIFVERELDKRVLPLSKQERELWFLDQKINNRGVYINQPAIKTALEIVAGEKKRLDQDMRKATGNQVATCNAHVALKDFINTKDIYKGEVYSSDGPPSKLKGKEGEPKWLKGERKICQGTGKDDVLKMLEMKLPAGVRKALLIKQEGAKSSTAKLAAMLAGVSNDGRVRGCFQFNGAASTQRWAGRRIQLQNMPRPTYGIKQSQIEEIVDGLENSQNDAETARDFIDIFHGQPMTRIADCLRAMLCAAPGKKLISADFSSIEGVGLAWLAGEENKLSIFRGHGRVYEVAACSIYGVTNIDDVTSDQRLVGKVSELACGYQGGVGAFQSMAKNYHLKISDKKADQVKKAWRNANPAIVSYWYNVERAALNAVQYAGEKFAVGPVGRKVIFLKKGSFLFCRLPSGRAICYPYPKIKKVKTPWGEMKDAVTYKGEENFQFVTKIAYGGLITENITQAMCRDLLAEAMPRVEAAGYSIVMHVHDEIVTEVDKNFGSLDELVKLMTILPAWAKDMPVKAAGWVGQRFRK